MFGRWFIKSMGQIWVVWEILKWSSIGEVFHLITSSSLKLESLNSGIEKWYWITFSCVLYWHCLRLHNTGYCKNRLDHSRMACNHWDQIWRVQIVSADTGHNLWILPRFSYTDTLQYFDDNYFVLWSQSVNHPRDIFVLLFLKRARPSNNHVIDGELVFFSDVNKPELFISESV
jgi:hypothetical protein